MRKTVAVASGSIVLLTGLMAQPAMAAPRDDYYVACLAASENDTQLCTCKADVAVKLLDERMLGFVILSMGQPQKFTALEQKGGVPKDVEAAWGKYVADSNRACHLNY
ncbi:MAG TPA: hypothetical protein VGM83_04060 [Devosiaceae bacterium]|jgi:hypothetical protein